MILETWQIEMAAVALVLVLAVREEIRPWSETILSGPSWAYASAVTMMLFRIEVFGVIDVYLFSVLRGGEEIIQRRTGTRPKGFCGAAGCLSLRKKHQMPRTPSPNEIHCEVSSGVPQRLPCS
jgi:hypothetical protein